MKYVVPLNDSSYAGRNGSYVDANPSTGVPGSTVPGKAIEHPQKEIENAIKAAGLIPSEDDLTQLTQVLNTPWQKENLAPTRTGDYTITLAGDQTATYPIGKRLRFNGDDQYLCRIFGDPTYANSVTSVTVWFDDRTKIIPATVTKFERSRLTPQDTANGAHMSGTDSEETISTLLASYCCGGYWTN
ncbi:MAG: hypothetical protein RRY12_01260 [Cloacibacillus sp.]